jgi:hypothetical protein
MGCPAVRGQLTAPPALAGTAGSGKSGRPEKVVTMRTRRPCYSVRLCLLGAPVGPFLGVNDFGPFPFRSESPVRRVAIPGGAAAGLSPTPQRGAALACAGPMVRQSRVGPRLPAPPPTCHGLKGPFAAGRSCTVSLAPRRRNARRPAQGISFALAPAGMRTPVAQNRRSQPVGPAARIVRYRPLGPPP